MIPKILNHFIGPSQLVVLKSCLRGEEKEFFKQKLATLAQQIESMPKSYETDGQGNKAIVHLHYFVGSANWYITEKDSGSHQLQAFGKADLFGDGGELGYISIEEILANGGELDLYWTTKPLSECD